MKSESCDFYTFSTKFTTKRSRVRVIEWLIAAVFAFTLLISSGVFLKVSNAADSRVQEKERHNRNFQTIVPGTLGVIAKKKQVSRLPLQNLTEEMDDNSCELKT